MKIKGRTIFPGTVQAEALVSKQGISFYGGVDPATGIIMEKGHDLEGQCIAGKILVFPAGKGSTVGSYSLYRLKKANLAPLAIINAECETIIAVGCIIAEIPCIDQVDLAGFTTGCKLTLNADEGWVTINA